MAINKDFIKKYPVPIYFTLTFIISWGAILILTGPEGIPATMDNAAVLGVAMLLGPSMSSILLTGLVSGRAGFRGLISLLFRWRVGIRWYLFALLAAPLLTAAVLLVLSLYSKEFIPGIFTSDDKLTLMLLAAVAGLTVGLFEELGWTGFAIPRMMLPYGVLTTGLIVGVLWGLWHFPLFWESDSFSGIFPLILLFARLFSWLPAFRVLMIWIYNRTESLLVVILMHASLTFTVVALEPPLTGGALLTFIFLKAFVLWIIVAFLARRGQLKKHVLGRPVKQLRQPE